MDLQTFIATKVTRENKPGSVVFKYKANGNNIQSVTFSNGIFDLSPKQRTAEACALLYEYFTKREVSARLLFRKPAGKGTEK